MLDTTPELRSAQRRIVLMGTGSGVGAGLVFAAIYALLPEPAAVATLPERLALGVRCAAVGALVPMAGIILVAMTRFLGAELNPLARDGSHRFRILERCLGNTVEQFVLFAVGIVALASVLGPEQMRVLGPLTGVFMTGRIAFWIAYLVHPMHRSWGNLATWIASFGPILYVTWTLITGG